MVKPSNESRVVSLSAIGLACLLLGSWTGGAWAGQWPQILGPQRNGVAVDEHLADAWPDGGPRALWSHPVGSGFAGAAVADGAAVVFHRIADEEVVEALDATSGKLRWRSSFPARYKPTFTDDDGPRAVPLVDRGRVYLYGAMGNLYCLELASGRTLWTRDTYEEFNSKRRFHGDPPEGYFGFGSTPIVEGDKLLVNVGGDAQGAGIVAFACSSGRTVWKATGQRASYSSPVAVTVDGTRHVIFVTRLAVVSVDAESGRARFELPFGRVGPTVTAASPVVFDGNLFVTASYGIGAALAKIGPDRTEVLWRDAEVLSSQYTTPIYHDGCLFGIDGRQDGPPADLKCFDPKTRRVRWVQPSFGYATLLEADGKLLILKTDGVLVLAALDTRRYEELARARVSDVTTRALPALAGGRLYVRDARMLKCLDLGAPGSEKKGIGDREEGTAESGKREGERKGQTGNPQPSTLIPQPSTLIPHPSNLTATPLPPLAQVDKLHRLVRAHRKELLVGSVALLVVLGLAYVAWEAVHRRRRKPVRPQVDLQVDVAALEAVGPPPAGPLLTFYNQPVRLAVIVLAPAGRWGQLPPLEQIHGVLDAIVPGLADVAVAHQSMLYYWPPQLSSHGFAHGFFRYVPLPGDGGKGTPWCAAAGGFKIKGQPAVAGLVMAADRPNSLGQLIVESETKWLDVLRVKARSDE